MPPPTGNRWTAEEDRTLKALVAKHGPRWKTVAHAMRTKTDSQCARRWENRFVPRKPRDWTVKEDLVLVAGHKLFGKRWKRIASRIGSRSADAARNRWASLVKRMPLLERNHEYDAALAQAEVSGQQRSSCAETESQSSQGVSTCHHDGGSAGTALSPDSTALSPRTPPTRQARTAQPAAKADAFTALAPMTPPPRALLMPRSAVACLASDAAPRVKVEASVAAFAAAPTACKREPSTPRSAVSTHGQASSRYAVERKYERHAPILSLWHGPRDTCGYTSSMATPHGTAAPPTEEDADFDVVDWIPASIAGADAGLWRSDWHGPSLGLSALPCAYW